MRKFSLKKQFFLVYAILLFLFAFQSPINAKVDASKYGAGFNSTDATSTLQGAINSKADTVLVPYMGSDWIVRPIKCVSNQTIIFEKGVNIVAKPGAFGGNMDALFKIESVSNVSLIGYGATFRMQKAEYLRLYPALGAEGRHCVAIYASSGVRILGLILRDSGGDGVGAYFASSNILIKDVICDNNERQGMSPCDLTNFTIENCVMINTIGAPPGAGVDFEPGANSEKLSNIKVINSYMANNAGSGMIVLGWWTASNSTSPYSMDIKHCFISTKNWSAIDLGNCPDGGPKGTVFFEDCIGESSFPSDKAGGGLGITGKSANAYLAKFTNCLWQNSNTAIKFCKGNSGAQVLGNIQFVNCSINEPDQQFTIRRDFAGGTFGLANITGNLKINCPYGLASASLGTGNNVTLQLTENKSKPPVINSVIPDKGNPDKVIFFNSGAPIGVSAQAFDPDNGTTSGAGISKVDFALWRGDAAVATFSDVAAPYAWPITLSSKCPRGIYLIRITAYSNDGSFSVAVVPIYIYNILDGTGPYVSGTGIESNYKTVNFVREKDFLIRNSSQGFMVYSPFAADSRIMISDLSGRQVSLAQTVKGQSWNNIVAQNKLLSGVYFIQTTDSKESNSIVKKVMVAK
jgi:hypothetical protein